MLSVFDLREKVIVLDWGWIIVDEYRGVNRPKNKLTEQDYGLQVVLHKYSSNQSFGFFLDLDVDGKARIPNPDLEPFVTDLDDRKMVSAVLAAGGGAGGCNLVNCCDTDWYDCKAALVAADVHVQQLIPDWCHAKWRSKECR